MKSCLSRLLILVLVASPLITTSASAVVLDSGAASDASASQVPNGPNKLSDILQEDRSSSKIPCPKALPKQSAFMCQSPSDFLSLDYASNTYSGKVTQNKFNPTPGQLVVKSIKDPEILQRELKGYKLQQGLDARHVQKIYEIEAGVDYLTLINDGIFNSKLILAFYRRYWTEKETGNVARNVRRAYELIRYLHERGLVALNFEIGSYEVIQTGLAEARVGGLKCMVKMGEEVGKCSFDPLTTEPLVLQSPGSAKADVAMDFYALGIKFLVMLKNDDYDGIKPEVEEAIEAMKQKGEIKFDAGSEVSLALLVSSLLQADRDARAQVEVIQQIVKLAADDHDMPKLAGPLTYKVQDNPLEVPEFREFVNKLILPNGDGFFGFLRGVPHWVWALFLALVVAGVAVIFILWYRSKNGHTEAAGETNQKLGEPTGEGLEVIATEAT